MTRGVGWDEGGFGLGRRLTLFVRWVATPIISAVPTRWALRLRRRFDDVIRLVCLHGHQGSSLLGAVTHQRRG